MQTTPSTSRSMHVLRVDASARIDGSITRQLADRMVEGLQARLPEMTVIRRDVAQGLPFVDATWVNANLADPDARDASQREALAGSDALVAEVELALVDLVAPARLTFRYTDQGPQGLLAGKKV